MTAYKRIVTYLYLCQKTAPPKNIGFAKVESVGETCRIEIHLRYQQELPIYIFTRQGEIIQGVLIGKMQELRSGSLFKKTFPRENVGDSEYRLEDMGGFVLPIDDDNMIAGQWDKKDIIRQQFRIWEPPQLEAASEVALQQSKNSNLTAQQLAQTMQQISEIEQRHSQMQQRVQNQMQQNMRRSQQAVRAERQTTERRKPLMERGEQQVARAERQVVRTERQMERAESQTARMEKADQQDQHEYTWSETWERLEEDGELYEPMEGVNAKAFRMDIKDLHTLPRHLWSIGNNSFLLHGFFNYRFLLVGKMRRGETEQYFIGVPGVFSNQESVIASVFGFTEFYCEKITDVKTGQSGFWCSFYETVQLAATSEQMNAAAIAQPESEISPESD